MKILFIVDNFAGGGKERRLLELIKGIERLDGDFKLYLLILGKDVFYEDILNTNCQVKRLYRGKGIELRIFQGIKNTIKEFEPDIIHFWGEVGMTYLLPISIFNKIPLVSSIIANTSPRGGLFKKFLRKMSFVRCNLILSNTILGLRNYHAPLEKSKIIYNGFEFSRLADLADEQSIRERYSITSEFVLMMVGAYTTRKDYKTFLKATEKLIDHGYDITVITAGGGDYEYLKNIVQRDRIERYRFLNFQQDIESIMNISTVGVLCSNSKIHSEGISNALLEFMALRKPVVATNDGGNVELIEDQVSGYLVEAQDHISLANQLMALLKDPSLRLFMGERSRKIVEEKFSINNMVDQFLDQYTKLYRNKLFIKP